MNTPTLSTLEEEKAPWNDKTMTARAWVSISVTKDLDVEVAAEEDCYGDLVPSLDTNWEEVVCNQHLMLDDLLIGYKDLIKDVLDANLVSNARRIKLLRHLEACDDWFTTEFEAGEA